MHAVWCPIHFDHIRVMGSSEDDSGDEESQNNVSKSDICPKCLSDGKAGQIWIDCCVCLRFYHTTCIDLNELDKMEACRRKLDWICKKCKSAVNNSNNNEYAIMRAKYEELNKQHEKLLEILRTTINEKREDIKSSNVNNATRTYAEMAKNSREKTVEEEKNFVIMKPRTEEKKVKGIESTSGISKHLKNVKISQTKVKNDGSVVLQFPTKDHLVSAKKVLDKNYKQDFEIKEPKKIQPKVTILGVPSFVADSDLKKSLLEKNEELADLVVKKKLDFKILFKYEDKNRQNNFVLRVAPEIYNLIMQNYKAYTSMK